MMNRRKFLAIAGGTVLVAAGGYYGLSDKTNFTRDDVKKDTAGKLKLMADEQEILFLASLAPSGHNTQPWFIKYLEPYHWIIGNDKTRWLPAVDPTQRETVLSIGAFMQNLEYAANNFGYNCTFNVLAVSNQDVNMVDVKLVESSAVPQYDVQKIKQRRTVRSNYLSNVLKKEDVRYLINGESNFVHFVTNTSKEHLWLNEQTIEANRVQSYRDPAQKELGNWIRFSSKDAAQHRDGLTTGSMELEGISGWVLRNFYGKENVMNSGFRNQTIDKVKEQVSQSAGWLLITSKGNSVTTLLETGKRMQKLFLRVREKGIAIHPMTQILEERATSRTVNKSMGISDNIQFILRTGYLNNYPGPVSLRRSVDSFIHS